MCILSVNSTICAGECNHKNRKETVTVDDFMDNLNIYDRDNFNIHLLR